MAFADVYPLQDFLAISHCAWWRAGDVHSVMSREAAEARKNGVADFKYSAELMDAHRTAAAADAADKVVWDAAKKTFNEKVEQHLVALRAEGRLAPTGGIRGRDVSYATAWNDFVANRKGDYRTKWLFSAIGNMLVHFFVRMDDQRHSRKKNMPLGSHQPPSAEQAEAAWRAICDAMDVGTSGGKFIGWGIECQDQKTGDRCELRFENWTAVLMRSNENYDMVPALDVGPIPLVAASFDVPTGDLLLTDYLRVEGMNEALDFGDEEYEGRFDLSSSEGRTNRSIEHAKRHDMGYAQTTNTSVVVWRNPGTGALAVVQKWFGREEDEVDGVSPVPDWERVGDFSCDMWRVTAVDAQIARGLTKDGALDAHLALRGTPTPKTKDLPVAEANALHHEHCYANNVVRLAVEPGRWTIHCGDDFHKRMPRHRFGLPKGVTAWCVLTPPKPAKSSRREAA